MHKASLKMATTRAWLKKTASLALAAGLALGTTTATAGHVVAYVLTDHLGSPSIEMDIGRHVLKREVYGPYGQAQISPTDTGIGYTGHVQDGDTGLIYMQARYYDPGSKRFLSIDPVTFAPDHLNHFNPYWYAEGNPYKYTDPDGRNITTAFGGVLYESAQFVQGNGFDGQSVMGALADGYDGQGAGFASALGEDVLNFVSAGAAVKVVRVVSNLVKDAKVVSAVAKSTPDITKAYKRPSGATTAGQRASVQGKSCVDCGAVTSKQVADHKNPLVKEYYETGTIDTTRMRSIDAVQPQCPTCSAKQGAEMSRYSQTMKKDLGLD